ncbi:hypothetical protein TGARI_359180 [Toxoplasma gondii ARI]|uniref:Uncharacterized protein n=1 Tax=Toxoplasma gondii ARI TaxID=1074872 RepID=A0A139XUB9_TOXGO|nr:hypothetical protein TGARI_359180 [Toxoplasma gondii ARI]
MFTGAGGGRERVCVSTERTVRREERRKRASHGEGRAKSLWLDNDLLCALKTRNITDKTRQQGEGLTSEDVFFRLVQMVRSLQKLPVELQELLPPLVVGVDASANLAERLLHLCVEFLQCHVLRRENKSRSEDRCRSAQQGLKKKRNGDARRTTEPPDKMSFFRRRQASKREWEAEIGSRKRARQLSKRAAIAVKRRRQMRRQTRHHREKRETEEVPDARNAERK